MNASGVATQSSAMRMAADAHPAAKTPDTPLKPGGMAANIFHSAQGAMPSSSAQYMHTCDRRGSTLWQRWWM